MSFSIEHIQNIHKELSEALALFNHARYQSNCDITKNSFDLKSEFNITTKSGRTYKIASVFQQRDENWMPNPLTSIKLSPCPICENKKAFLEYSWIQFTYNENTAIIHGRLMHLFKMHPEKIPPKTLKVIAEIFLK